VLSQNFDDYELIIIDDGSTDNSREIIEQYRHNPKVTIIYQENKGLNVTNNIAVKLSKGKYVMRLDADDYLDENALLIMTQVINKDNKYGLVFPDYYLVDEFDNIISHVRRHDFKKDVTLYDQPAHGACTMIRKECLLEVGSYSEEFRCQDGFELWLKFIKNFRIENINLPLFYYRQHDESLTRDEEKLLTTRHKIIKKEVSELEILKKNHLCIIPIRGMEKGEPLALKKIGKKAIIDITLQSVFASENISNIIVSTPNSVIIDYLKNRKYDNIIINCRPYELARLNTDFGTTMDYIIEKYQDRVGTPDTILTVSIEYPIRNSIYFDTIINTLYLFDVDSVVAVKPENDVFYKHNGNGLMPVRGADRSLALERDFLFRETAGLRAIRYDFFKKSKLITGGKIGHIIVDEKASISVKSEINRNLLDILYKYDDREA